MRTERENAVNQSALLFQSSIRVISWLWKCVERTVKKRWKKRTDWQAACSFFFSSVPSRLFQRSFCLIWFLFQLYASIKGVMSGDFSCQMRSNDAQRCLFSGVHNKGPFEGRWKLQPTQSQFLQYHMSTDAQSQRKTDGTTRPLSTRRRLVPLPISCAK